MSEIETVLLTEDMCNAIDVELEKFPEDQKISACIAAIRIAQDLGEGWVSQDQLDAIAVYLDAQPMQVYEVASFYTMCKRAKVAKYNIGVCTNVSCMLNGAEDIVAHLQKRLGVGLDKITGDGLFSIEEVECMGACAMAPMCQIDKKYYEFLTIERVDQIIDELRKS